MANMKRSGIRTKLLAMQQIFSLVTAALAGSDSSQNVRSFFVFGDSYTDIGFRGNSPYPTLAEPFGYPKLGHEEDDNYLDGPSISANTTSNGPNWPEFLTMRYNTTPTLTYDFAISGASIPDGFNDQILLNYEPRYSDLFSASAPNKLQPSGGTSWSSTTSTFASWIGINDINWCSILFNNYPGKTFANCLPERFTEYYDLMDNLYNTGARNFMFVNIPPLERAPMVTQHGTAAISNYKEGVAYFNGNLLPAFVKNFTATHQGVKAVTYDAHTLFSDILDDPHAYGFKDASCYSCIGCHNVTGCFWSNNYHPVTQVQERIAYDMVGTVLKELGW